MRTWSCGRGRVDVVVPRRPAPSVRRSDRPPRRRGAHRPGRLRRAARNGPRQSGSVNAGGDREVPHAGHRRHLAPRAPHARRTPRPRPRAGRGAGTDRVRRARPLPPAAGRRPGERCFPCAPAPAGRVRARARRSPRVLGVDFAGGWTRPATAPPRSGWATRCSAGSPVHHPAGAPTASTSPVHHGSVVAPVPTRLSLNAAAGTSTSSCPRPPEKAPQSLAQNRAGGARDRTVSVL